MIYFSSVLAALWGYFFIETAFNYYRRMVFKQKLGLSLDWPGFNPASKKMTRGERQSLMKRLPDFLDLLAVALAAGNDLSRALWQVSSVFAGPEMKWLLTPLLSQLHMGIPREKVFENIQKRNLDPAASAVFGILLQALRHGSPLEDSLRSQAASIRKERQIQLEKKAQTIGLRLLIPIGIFIFPALLLLIFGGLGLMMKQDGFG